MKKPATAPSSYPEARRMLMGRSGAGNTQEAMAWPSVRAKLKGRQPGFSAKEDAAIARHLAEDEFIVGEIATMFKTSRASVYRAADRHRKRGSGAPQNQRL